MTFMERAEHFFSPADITMRKQPKAASIFCEKTSGGFALHYRKTVSFLNVIKTAFTSPIITLYILQDYAAVCHFISLNPFFCIFRAVLYKEGLTGSAYCEEDIGPSSVYNTRQLFCTSVGKIMLISIGGGGSGDFDRLL